MTDIKNLGTILSVWAHPDDESYFSAGIMASAVANGQTVVCVTATKGEYGTAYTTPEPPEQMAAIRSQELASALQILGVTQHHFLDVVDGTCKVTPTDEVIAKLQALIKQYQPDTILTFGPDGMTGHDDHCTVSKWVAQATQSSDIAVYHAVQPRELYEQMQAADQEFNIFFNIERPPLVAAEDCDLLLKLSPELLDKKFQGLSAMPSQTKKMIERLGKDAFCRMVGWEAFVKAR